MKITKKEVEYVANLGRLELTDEEKEKYTSQLNELLEHFEKLNELNTENIEPTFHVLQMKNVFREDVLQPSLERENSLMNAPHKTEKYFKVPKVIE